VLPGHRPWLPQTRRRDAAPQAGRGSSPRSRLRRHPAHPGLPRPEPRAAAEAPARPRGLRVAERGEGWGAPPEWD
jgi:hypothetical protein